MTKTDYEVHVESVIRGFHELTKQVSIIKLYDDRQIGIGKGLVINGHEVWIAGFATSHCMLSQVIRIQFDFVTLSLTLWVE